MNRETYLELLIPYVRRNIDTLRAAYGSKHLAFRDDVVVDSSPSRKVLERKVAKKLPNTQIFFATLDEILSLN